MAHIGVVNVATMLSLFGWLALLTNILTLVLVVAFVSRGPVVERFRKGVSAYAGRIMMTFTVSASLGSLYLSEIGELMPCKWCWFQRCAMYPLAIILVVGVAKGDKEQSMRSYATPIAVLGLMASIWHYLVQRVPALSDAESCSLSTPCAITYLEKFGFISIPWMAGSVFLLTIVLLLGFCSPEGSTR